MPGESYLLEYQVPTVKFSGTDLMGMDGPGLVFRVPVKSGVNGTKTLYTIIC